MFTHHHNYFTVCKSLLYFYSAVVIIDLQNFCTFTILLVTKIGSKILLILQQFFTVCWWEKPNLINKVKK